MIFKKRETKRKNSKNFKGHLASEETRKKMSESHKGKSTWLKGLTKETDERIRKISESNIKNFKNNPERRRKISEWHKNKHPSEETRKKMSKKRKGKGNPMYNKLGKNNPNYGKHRTLETRKKMSESLKGNTRMLGKHLSEEHKKKISKSQKGKLLSEEHKKNISISHKGILKGEKNGRWLGGKSFEPYTYDFNESFKNKIRKRDNYCCMICNKSKEERKKKLDIHHIDYNKLNSFPQNCVSLCNSCHTKTNGNRTSWTTFFQSLLKERYDYQYTQIEKKL